MKMHNQSDMNEAEQVAEQQLSCKGRSETLYAATTLHSRGVGNLVSENSKVTALPNIHGVYVHILHCKGITQL